jgi:L-asparaginase
MLEPARDVDQPARQTTELGRRRALSVLSVNGSQQREHDQQREDEPSADHAVSLPGRARAHNRLAFDPWRACLYPARVTADKRRVVLIGTGGTIGSLGRHTLDWEYMDQGLRQDPEALLAQVPEAAHAPDVVPVRFRAISSAKLGPPEWLEINDLVHEIVARERPDVVVLTHGTATLEETAYFLNLTLKTDVPLVVVGSQRPANMLSSDATMNLLGAVRVAAAPEARGLGALVLLNDEIQTAREVTKTSTSRLETFRSHDLGMLGYADADGCVAIYRRPARRHAPDTEFDVRGRRELPRVDIAYSYAGADGSAIAAFVTAGARGIVTASLAPGANTTGELEALRAARAQGVLIVQSTRAGSGRVLPRAIFREHGFVPADNLNPQKARVLAMLALTRTDDPREVERMFTEY